MRNLHNDFFSRHPGNDLASPNEIILISFQIRELLNNEDKLDNIIVALKYLERLNTIVDILCPAKKAPSPVKRVTRRTAQPGRSSSNMAIDRQNREPGHVPHPLQRQMQPHKHAMQVEAHDSYGTNRTRCS